MNLLFGLERPLREGRFCDILEKTGTFGGSEGSGVRRLVWFTLGFGAACGVGVYGAPGLLALPGAAVCLLLYALLTVLRHRGRAPAAGALVCLGLAAGLCWFCVYDGLLLQPARLADGKTVELELRVRDYPVPSESGCSVDGTVSLQGRRYKVRLYLAEEAPLEPGDTVSVPALLRLTTDGGSREPTYHRTNGIFLLAYSRGGAVVTGGADSLWDFPTRLRRAVGQRLEVLFPADTAGFARALLLGDKTGLTYAQRNALSLAGISHVAAVSGMHLSILFALVYLLTLRQRHLSAILGIPVLILFAAVAGFTPSVTRAAGMLGLMLLARLGKREYDSPTALALASLCLLAYNPVAAASAGFQLSVGAVAGILCFSRPLRRWLTQKLGRSRLLRPLAASVSVSLGATAFTAPIGACTFGVVSLLSPLTNLLTLWAVSLAFYGEIAACLLSLLWLPAGRAVARCTGWLLRYVLRLGSRIGNLPFAAVFPESSPFLWAWAAFALILLGVFLLGRCRGKAVLAGSLALSLCLSAGLAWLEPMTDRFRVTVLDVGQGQCVLLQSAGRTFVVDCGGTEGEGAGELAARYLLSRGVRRVDGLILTHFDGDHVSGALQLLARLRVDRLFLPRAGEDETCRALAEAAGERTVFVDEDRQLSFGEAELRIFAPLSHTRSNESGLSVLFTVGECDTLITGDMSRNLERRLLALHSLPDIELLVAGHHGSKNSTGLALLQAVRPEAVAVSVGPNSYGHPAPEMLERAAAQGCRIYRTDQAGTLIFRG